jgi:hypothetical protein
MIVPKGNVRGLWLYITLALFVFVFGYLLYQAKYREAPIPATTMPLSDRH